MFTPYATDVGIIHLDEYQLEHLQALVDGQVIVPGDADYDRARAAWNLTVDQRPAVIVIPAHAQDVAATMRFAALVDLDVAVQSTGHGVARLANDGLLLITSNLKGVQINAAAQTAWVAAGEQWGAVLEAAQAVGLAPLLGSTSGVGAVGYTLGGGMGWLARKYGLSADSVLQFELVTPSAEAVIASPTENADLFWALGGGGGAFGVITGMEIKLYPVTTVYGGTLIYPAAMAREVLQFYREWNQYLPDEWTTSVALMNLPPLPELPPFLSGQSVVMVNGCYAGDSLSGQMMAQAWMDWRAPLVNGFHQMPFREVDSISNDPKDPLPGRNSGAWMADLSDDAIETILRFALPAGGPPALVKTEIRQAGGAMATEDPYARAYSHRSAPFILQTVGMAPTPEALQAVDAHVRAFKAALAPHLTGGTYLNFLEADEKYGSLRQSYEADKVELLKGIKAKYDPLNRLNRALQLFPDSNGPFVKRLRSGS
jgi:FAD/FMN-containing dehydrogenase